MKIELTVPTNQAEIKSEATKWKAEIAVKKADLAAYQAALGAIQAICQHPNKENIGSYDPRDPGGSSNCPDCFKQWWEMNKLGKREYIQLIADTLVEEYGQTLKESGTDVQMAKAVVETLDQYLFFHKQDVPYQDYRDWEKRRKS